MGRTKHGRYGGKPGRKKKKNPKRVAAGRAIQRRRALAQSVGVKAAKALAKKLQQQSAALLAQAKALLKVNK